MKPIAKLFRKMKRRLLPVLAAVGLSAQADVVQVFNADITGTVNWYQTNTYVLNSFVYVETNEVLNIEAGTVIKGQTNATPATIAALVVARGGKIYANGTANSPIIFTSVLDDVNDPQDLSLYQRGLWGGIVICGKAELNTASNAGGNAASPKYDVFEGLADIENHRFGGNDDTDDSGIFRYVSIRHGGKVLESNKEINGLSLCGVGSGTTIEYVETYAIQDDGFEFFGGTVNTKYLVSAFNDDDAFDTDQGYRGKNQFWFAIQEPGTRDKGGEFNGEPQTIGIGVAPIANWEVYNATWIGAGVGSGGANNNGFTIRDYAAPKVFNSVITDFAQRGVSIDATAGSHLTNGNLQFANNVWFGFGGGDTAANIAITANAQVLFTNSVYSNSIVNPLLRAIDRGDNGLLDPRPQTGSPALSGAKATPNDGFYTAANYKGAFDANDLWLAGWTALSEYQVLPQTGANVVQVNNASISGTVNWYRTNTYVLNGFVYVENGEVLNIEAGTVIQGNTNATPATIAALVVARGGKIYANGTANSPIIFTSVLDDVNDAGDLSLYQRGLWGGVVICGRSQLNTASNAGGNATSPKYDVFEGLADIENHRYGGTNDNDNSGVFRYVSIRHGGKVLESNKEINGLSLCAVGRGTTIEFVETYAIQDDGFEFFGGTVNTRHLISAFNDDDAFDTDQGYRGKNQFWFAIQEPGVRDKGGEFNGEPQTIAVGAAPMGKFEVYNATWIGAGTGSGGANNNGFTVRDYAAPNIFSSIITDFAQRGVSIDATAGSHLTNGNLQFANNIWFGFGGGNTAANIAVTANAQILFTDAARTNSIVDPQLIGISRADDLSLDPRPDSGSPAWSDFAVVTNPLYEQTDYRGAFGEENWAADWTALAEYGVLRGDRAGTPVLSAMIVPTVLTGPINQSVNAGTNVTFTVTADNALEYQWSLNGTPISGATDSSYTRSNVQTNHQGAYSVIVSNYAGTASASATLAVVPDTTKPQVKITTPASGANLTDTNVINYATAITGTAADNVLVADVQISVNGQPYSSVNFGALGKNVNWSTNITVVPGTNTIAVKSIDLAGNESTVAARLFKYVVLKLFTLNVTGLGSVAPTASPSGTPADGAMLQVGQGYKLTAANVFTNGYLFTNWTADWQSQSTTVLGTNGQLVLNFIMQSNLTLNANFITNPFRIHAGIYNGLFYEADEIRHHNAGHINLKTTDRLGYGGKLLLDGDAISISGKFSLDGKATNVVQRGVKFGKTNLIVRLAMDFAGASQAITGTIRTNEGSGWIADILADKATWQTNGLEPGTKFVASPNPSTVYSNAYTMVIPGFDDNADGPVGYGYALVNLNDKGEIKIAGALSDGQTIKQASVLSKNGQWPFLAMAYFDTNDVVAGKVLTRGRGTILGWLNFAANTHAFLENTNLAPLGTLDWIKTAAATNASWTGGFTNQVDVLASKHQPPAVGATTASYPFTNSLAFLTDGALLDTITNRVFLKTNDTFFVDNNNTNTVMSDPPYNHLFKASLDKKKGYISGTFTNAPSVKPIPWKGVLLQDYTNTTLGYGWFTNNVTTNASGQMRLERLP